MDVEIIDIFGKKQKKNIQDAILSLYCATVYANICSSMSLPGEIDNIINQLENLYKEIYNNKKGIIYDKR